MTTATGDSAPSPVVSFTRQMLYDNLPSGWSEELQADMFWLFGATKGMLEPRVQSLSMEFEAAAAAGADEREQAVRSTRIALHGHYEPAQSDIDDCQASGSLAYAWYCHVTQTMGRPLTYIDGAFMKRLAGAAAEEQAGEPPLPSEAEAADRDARAKELFLASELLAIVRLLPPEVREGHLKPFFSTNFDPAANFDPVARHDELLTEAVNPLVKNLNRITIGVAIPGFMALIAGDVGAMLYDKTPFTELLWQTGSNALMAALFVWFGASVLKLLIPSKGEGGSNARVSVLLNVGNQFKLESLASGSAYAAAWLNYVKRQGRKLYGGDVEIVNHLLKAEEDHLRSMPQPPSQPQPQSQPA